MRRGKILAAGVILVVASVVAIWIGSGHQQTRLSAQVDRLMRPGTTPRAPTRCGIDGLDGAPAPVSRYLRRALRTERLIQHVRIGQKGALRTDVRSERWTAFEAEHIVVPPAIGFVWNARIEVAPLLHVRVVDALIAGRGSGQVSLLSAFTVASDAGTPQMNSGSLHRFLAEAVWYPSALFPSAHLQWTSIDATRALATLTDHDTSVSLEFRFADTGEVTGIYTPARWGKFSQGYKQVAWEGHFRDYRDRDGIWVPTEGDVGWYVDNQWQAVWKGNVTTFHTDALIGPW